MPEQLSDDGLDDELADAHLGMQLLNAQMAAVSFETEDDALMARMTLMNPGSDDEDQGGDSDCESYGKVEEPVPHRA